MIFLHFLLLFLDYGSALPYYYNEDADMNGNHQEVHRRKEEFSYHKSVQGVPPGGGIVMPVFIQRGYPNQQREVLPYVYGSKSFQTGQIPQGGSYSQGIEGTYGKRSVENFERYIRVGDQSNGQSTSHMDLATPQNQQYETHAQIGDGTYVQNIRAVPARVEKYEERHHREERSYHHQNGQNHYGGSSWELSYGKRRPEDVRENQGSLYVGQQPETGHYGIVQREESLYGQQPERLEIGQEESLYGGQQPERSEIGQREESVYGGQQPETGDFEVGQKEESLYGGQQPERLEVGQKEESLYGGQQPERLELGQKEESLYGGQQPERLEIGQREESLYGGQQPESGDLELGQKEESLYGGQQPETGDFEVGQKEESLYGGQQPERLELGQKEESLYGGQQPETLEVGQKEESLHGGQQPETGDLELGQREESLYVGQQPETLEVGQKEESLYGGQQPETLEVGQKEESLNGGQQPETGDLELGQKEESLYVGQQPETLDIGQKEESLNGGQQPEALEVGQKEESLYGSQQTETGDLELGQKEESLYGGQQPETLDIEQKEESFNGGQQPEALEVGQKEESLNGGQQPEALEVGQKEDSLYGGQQPETIEVGQREESLYGGQQPETGNFEVGQKEEGLYEGQKPEGLEVEHKEETIDRGQKPATNYLIVGQHVDNTDERITEQQLNLGEAKTEILYTLGQKLKDEKVNKHQEEESLHTLGQKLKDENSPDRSVSGQREKADDSSEEKPKTGMSQGGQKIVPSLSLGQLPVRVDLATVQHPVSVDLTLGQRPINLGALGSTLREHVHTASCHHNHWGNDNQKPLDQRESNWHYDDVHQQEIGSQQWKQTQQQFHIQREMHNVYDEQKPVDPVLDIRTNKNEGYQSPVQRGTQDINYGQQPVFVIPRDQNEKQSPVQSGTQGINYGQQPVLDIPRDQNVGKYSHFHRETHNVNYGQQPVLDISKDQNVEKYSHFHRETHNTNYGQMPVQPVFDIQTEKPVDPVLDIRSKSKEENSESQRNPTDQEDNSEVPVRVEVHELGSVNLQPNVETERTGQNQQLGSGRVTEVVDEPVQKISTWETHKEEYYPTTRKTYSKKHRKYSSSAVSSSSGSEAKIPEIIESSQVNYDNQQGSTSKQEHEWSSQNGFVNEEPVQRKQVSRTQAASSVGSPDRHAQIEGFLAELEKDINNDPNARRQQGSSVYVQPGWQDSKTGGMRTTSYSSSHSSSSSSSASGAAPTESKSWYKRVGDSITTSYQQAKDKAKEIVRNVKDTVGQT